MSKIHKVYAPTEITLNAVQYMKVSDNCADVFLRKNIGIDIVNTDLENAVEQEMNTADELYFQVDASIISEQEITKNFQKYWVYGEQWIDERDLSEKEKIERLESQNTELNQCILALCAMI